MRSSEDIRTATGRDLDVLAGIRSRPVGVTDSQLREFLLKGLSVTVQAQTPEERAKRMSPIAFVLIGLPS